MARDEWAVRGGDYIRKLREALGLSIEEVGRRMERTGATIGRWERGVNQPNIQQLNKLASALENTTPERLAKEYGMIMTVAPTRLLPQKLIALLLQLEPMDLQVAERHARGLTLAPSSRSRKEVLELSNHSRRTPP